MKRTAGSLIAAVVLIGSATVLTGRQAPAPEFDRTVSVNELPSRADRDQNPGQSAGFDVHLGPDAFALTCSTDTVGDGSRGTAAVICTWTNSPR